VKKILFALSALALSSSAAFSAPEPTGHPWLDKELAKDRYPCPPGTSPFRGAADAPVTITEFVDYECPYCGEEEKTIKKVLEAYPTQVKVVIKQMPLGIHPTAKHKALVAECMGMQDKFWQAHERFLSGNAKEVRKGANQKKLDADIAQGGQGQVDKDLALAKKLGMATTPSFVVDGIRQGGTIGFNQFKLLIDAELARKTAMKEAKQAKAAAKEGNNAQETQ